MVTFTSSSLSNIFPVVRMFEIEANKYLLRGTLGGSEHCDTAKNIAQHCITARKVDRTPSPQYMVLVWWYKGPHVIILFKIISFDLNKSLKQTHHKSKTVVTLLFFSLQHRTKKCSTPQHRKSPMSPSLFDCNPLFQLRWNWSYVKSLKCSIIFHC